MFKILFPIFIGFLTYAEWEIVVPPNEYPLAVYCATEDQRTGIKIKGDFNGDSKEDIAKLEEDHIKKMRRLAIYFNGQNKPFVAEEGLRGYKASNTFIRLIKSKPKDMIGFGTCEASEKIMIWNSKNKKFDSKWVSD